MHAMEVKGMAPQFLFGRIDIFLREAKVSFAENTTFK